MGGGRLAPPQGHWPTSRPPRMYLHKHSDTSTELLQSPAAVTVSVSCLCSDQGQFHRQIPTPLRNPAFLRVRLATVGLILSKAGNRTDDVASMLASQSSWAVNILSPSKVSHLQFTCQPGSKTTTSNDLEHCPTTRKGKTKANPDSERCAWLM